MRCCIVLTSFLTKVDSVVSANGTSWLCATTLPAVGVTVAPVTMLPRTVSNLVNAPTLYLASEILTKLPVGATVTERTSSPIIQHSAGTMIGNVSVYDPVLTCSNELGIIRAGMLSAFSAVIASVMIPTNPVIVGITFSASNEKSMYCSTIDVELSPFNT